MVGDWSGDSVSFPCRFVSNLMDKTFMTLFGYLEVVGFRHAEGSNVAFNNAGVLVRSNSKSADVSIRAVDYFLHYCRYELSLAEFFLPKKKQSSDRYFPLEPFGEFLWYCQQI